MMNLTTTVLIVRAQAYVIRGLDTHVREWFVNVSMRGAGMAAEVQPLATAEFNTFLE